MKIKSSFIDSYGLYEGTEFIDFALVLLYDLLLQTWDHCSRTHKLGCRYWSNVRGFGPPNQSIKNIFSISNLKNWNSWSLGQPVNHPRHKNQGQKWQMKAKVLLISILVITFHLCMLWEQGTFSKFCFFGVFIH